MNRDILEELWGRGFINVDRLQSNEEGFTALVKYMAKERDTEESKYSRSWRSSVGLKKPNLNVNDCNWTGRKMKRMLMQQPSREEIERLYPGYTLTNYEIKYNQEWGQVYMDIQMRRWVKNKKIEGSNYYKVSRRN